MRIGDITLEHGIFLAPMAGVSDLPFRLLCREQGCEMAVTEMVSAKAIWYNRPLRTALEQMSGDGPFPFGDRGTTELLRTVPEDRLRVGPGDLRRDRCASGEGTLGLHRFQHGVSRSEGREQL